MFNLSLVSIKSMVSDFIESRERIKRIKKVYDFDALKKVRISVRDSSFSDFIKLQTPKQLGVWSNTAFVSTFNPDVDLVINKPNPYLKLSSNSEKNWMLHIEPPGYIKKLRLDAPEVMAKFGRVYTPDPDLFEKGGKFIASPPYVHWHLALSSYANNPGNIVYDYDFLESNQAVPAKKVSLAAINSNIGDLPGHKLRADFISKISESNLDYRLYGAPVWSKYKQYKGRALDGKWPVYSESKYVLAIENEVADYYWTEKFTDAILCFSMPIYHGSPKIHEYFPEGSYIPIDISKRTAADDLRDILASDYYEKNIPKLIQARKMILSKYNMFNFINAEINNSPL